MSFRGLKLVFPHWYNDKKVKLISYVILSLYDYNHPNYKQDAFIKY
jgi:hypothetical protein